MVKNRPLKVIWLGGKVLSQPDRGGTGTWLDVIAQGLVHSGKVHLGNITSSNVTQITKRDDGPIQQWLIPSSAKPMKQNGSLTDHYARQIIEVVEAFAPDLIHIWGTELHWGLYTARKLLKGHALLEIHGLKSAIAQVYSGGMSVRSQLSAIGIKEIVKGGTLFQQRQNFERWRAIEAEIIRGHHYITVQSTWLQAKIRAVNDTCTIFRNEFPLRESFYAASPWHSTRSGRVFCSAAYPAPFKGVHDALIAIAVLQKTYPNIQLRIAGAMQKQGIRQDGYVNWLNKEIMRLGIAENVNWLGPLSGSEIVSELQNCEAVVMPTYVEGYCLALAEAMILGVPAVVSYTGGTAYLAKDEDSALFFQPGDTALCAYQLDRVFRDHDLAARLSQRSREVAMARHNLANIVQRQIEIYEKITALV